MLKLSICENFYVKSIIALVYKTLAFPTERLSQLVQRVESFKPEKDHGTTFEEV